MASGRSRDGRDKDHVYCFVPGEGIDVVVLATYLKRWIDGTATIEPSRHPRNRDVLGFNVGASSTLSREALKDLRDDSAKWQEEQNTRDFQRSPYDYVESDTFAERKKRGPTPHDDTQLRLAKPRTRPSQPESYGRSAREETQRKNADVGSDKPPDYNQVTGSDRARRSSRSSSPSHPRPQPGQPGPRPSNPHPISFGMEKLTLDEEQTKPSQRAGNKSSRYDATSKSYARPDERATRRGSHGESQY